MENKRNKKTCPDLYTYHIVKNMVGSTSAFGSPNSHRLDKREYNNNKNHILESKYILMVLIRCPECGANTDLAAAYYNVEDAEVRCSGCKVKLTVTLKNGEIKKIETKGPGIG